MGFEEVLQRVVAEYQAYLSSLDDILKVDAEEIKRIHNRLKPTTYVFGEPLHLLQRFDLMMPEAGVLLFGEKIGNEPKDGWMEVYYIYTGIVIESITLRFLPGLLPPVMQPQGERWVWVGHGCHSDIMYNETEFGRLRASLAEGNGCFFPKDPKTGKLLAGFDISLWSYLPSVANFVSTLKFPVEVLGKGYITAFFKHMGYSKLDELLG
ncbi:hypothetical protein DRJ48_02650 [Candidatus Woesearchaeota archaeon]|nr:hypothetical protein [Candidatus Woesearchaeota archaeon]RLE42817.1 MAG: hypothetical protein DRJ48_02650 [Candidatus Woesearchaeota archaeon]